MEEIQKQYGDSKEENKKGSIKKSPGEVISPGLL